MRIDFDTDTPHPIYDGVIVNTKKIGNKTITTARLADTDTPQLHATIARNAARSIHKQAAELADTIPPVEPPPPVALAQPKAHRVVAWRHDGGIDNTQLATLELAREFAARCHWAIYWKTMIMCGREMVARALIEEPQS